MGVDTWPGEEKGLEAGQTAFTPHAEKRLVTRSVGVGGGGGCAASGPLWLLQPRPPGRVTGGGWSVEKGPGGSLLPALGRRFPGAHRARGGAGSGGGRGSEPVFEMDGKSWFLQPGPQVLPATRAPAGLQGRACGQTPLPPLWGSCPWGPHPAAPRWSLRAPGWGTRLLSGAPGAARSTVSLRPAPAQDTGLSLTFPASVAAETSSAHGTARPGRPPVFQTVLVGLRARLRTGRVTAVERPLVTLEATLHSCRAVWRAGCGVDAPRTRGAPRVVLGPDAACPLLGC